jgi:hypothetical protein
MTMKVTVKNEDPSRNALVTQLDKQRDGTKKVRSTTPLTPGATKEFWIYSGDTGSEITVEEA